MRSTAPAAVAASISCSRARLVALRRQVRAVPAVHITIGRISVTQSSRFRSAPRCRSPQHPRRREAPTSRSTRPTASARSDPIPQLGMSPASRAAPCRGPCRPGCRPESPGPLTPAGSCRCRPPECVRLPSAHRGAPPLAAHPNGTTTTAAATATCTDRDAMQPASRSTIVRVGRRSQAVPPVQAEVGVTRLMTAGGAAWRGHLERPSCFQSDGRRGEGNKSSIRQPK